MNKYTQELIDGMNLILKYQPNATYDLEESYGIFMFGSLDTKLSEKDKQQLRDWNWKEYTDTVDGNGYWSHF